MMARGTDFDRLAQRAADALRAMRRPLLRCSSCRTVGDRFNPVRERVARFRDGTWRYATCRRCERRQQVARLRA